LSGPGFQDQVERRFRGTAEAAKTSGKHHVTKPGFASLGTQGHRSLLTQGCRHADHCRGGVVNPANRVEVALDGIAGIGFDDEPSAVGAERLAHVAGRAEFLLGNFSTAEQAERAALEARKHWPSASTSDRRQLGELTTWLAMTLARQGHLEEAAREIAPVVKFQRELAARNHGDQWQPVELASALYAQAMADKTQRARLLREAAGLLDNVAPALRSLHDVRRWRERISEATQATATTLLPAASLRGAG